MHKIFPELHQMFSEIQKIFDNTQKKPKIISEICTFFPKIQNLFSEI